MIEDSKERELYLIRKALEEIAKGFKTIVEDGITIYEHQSGPEQEN